MPITISTMSTFLPIMDKLAAPLIKKYAIRTRIDFCYEGSLNSKKKITLPSKDDKAYKSAHWNAYTYKIIEDIMSLKRAKGLLYIPTPMITSLGIRLVDYKPLRNNNKHYNYFSKKVNWLPNGDINSKNLIISDNNSINNNMSGYEIKASNKKTPRGGVKNRRSYKKLKSEIVKYLTETKHDKIHIFLPSSPMTCFVVGEIIRDISKEFLLYSYVKKYSPIVLINTDNSIQFLDI